MVDFSSETTEVRRFKIPKEKPRTLYPAKLKYFQKSENQGNCWKSNSLSRNRKGGPSAQMNNRGNSNTHIKKWSASETVKYVDKYKGIYA